MTTHKTIANLLFSYSYHNWGRPRWGNGFCFGLNKIKVGQSCFSPNLNCSRNLSTRRFSINFRWASLQFRGLSFLFPVICAFSNLFDSNEYFFSEKRDTRGTHCHFRPPTAGRPAGTRLCTTRESGMASTDPARTHRHWPPAPREHHPQGAAARLTN